MMPFNSNSIRTLVQLRAIDAMKITAPSVHCIVLDLGSSKGLGLRYV